MTNLLVTGAGGSAGANFIDALRRASSDYFVVGTDVVAEFLHLSPADERIVIHDPTHQMYLDVLNEAVSKWDIGLVHPQPDPDVMAIGRLRDRLETKVFLPSQKALEIAADKAEARNVLDVAGVAVPSGRIFEHLADIAGAIADLLERTSRVWMRARRGAGARASLPVSHVDQALAWIRWWIDEKGLTASDFMASEFLPGRELAYQSVWQDGELVTGQLRQRLAYLYGHLTPSGQTSSPSIAATVNIPAADATAMAAVRAA